ncbi:MAG: S-layer homology domain-containing protein [Candidatus Riflebacteria bacterium]|nr:S-layer homology domain-containing protein [Candidatus Riflebacteria bacterium]
MRQKQNNSCFNSRFYMVMFIFVCIIFSGKVYGQDAPASAFQDLPKDHWAYQDVDYLVKQGYMEGFPDGTFKGRKIITRYDVALIIGRMLKRLDEKSRTSNESTESERASLARLTKEFKDELGLLGVRVDTLERRMNDSESKLKNLENTLPKVRVSGYYRGHGLFLSDPRTVLRNEYGDKSTYQDPGATLIRQRYYIQFTGKPLGERIESFLELQGYIYGKTFNKLIYNDIGKNNGANPFDKIDDYVTKIQNDRDVEVSKIHFVSNAQSMKVRYFANESVTGINDPMNILTEDTDIVNPYHGLEVSGSGGGVTYQGSLLKIEENKGPSDLKEMIAGRLVWKLPSKFSPDSLSIGTSFAEKINDYKIRGNSNTVRGVDVSYTTERAGKIQATAEFLSSDDYHQDTRDKKTRSLGDEGTKFDVSIQNGGFTGTVKHYDYGKEFRALMAPIWAFDIGDGEGYPYGPSYKENYGHDGFYGEKLTRFSAGYDFGNKLFSIAKNLSMEATWLSKTWEVDQNAPQPTDGYSGRKFNYQLISDFTDSTTLKYDFEEKYDALSDEQGTMQNTLELNLRLNDSVSTKGKVFVLTDNDDTDTVGDTTYKYNERVGYFEINSNINPRVFAKGSVEHSVEWVNAPQEGIRIDYIGESTYNLTPSTSITGGVQHVDYESRNEKGKCTLANAVLAELKKNFTKKFRGRAFYRRGVIDFKDGLTDSVDRESMFGEVIYEVSKDASLKLRYGYDFPDLGRWDISTYENGRGNKDMSTMKMFLFEAKASF